MNREPDTNRLILLPIMNLIAVASVVFHGSSGLWAIYGAMVVFHSCFSLKDSVLADMTLWLTVLPLSQLLLHRDGFSIAAFCGSLLVLSALLSVMALFRERLQAGRLEIGHPLK